MTALRTKNALAVLCLVALPALFAPACSQNQLSAKGGTCFQAIDCAPGLFCLTDGGQGVCSDCTSCVATVPDAAGDTTVPDGTPVDSPTDQMAADNNVPETSTDTGTQDTGTQDTGTDAPPPT